MIGGCGFAAAVLLVLSLQRGGGFFAAPVCSSWVWLNRGTSRRAVWSPLGDSRVESVRAGNMMVVNVVLLCYLVTAMGLFWAIEQVAVLFLAMKIATERDSPLGLEFLGGGDI